MAQRRRVLILGAGYTGLAAAVECHRLGIPAVLVERSEHAGGLSRTISVDGMKFELGPHIYFDKDPDVAAYWRSLPHVRFETHERNNRIYYQGKYIKSPLSVVDTLVKLGPWAVVRILASFARSKLWAGPVQSAQDWVEANFGKELFRRFFKVYNEKIWGVPSNEMAVDWAGQRIKSSLPSMIFRSVRRDKAFVVKTFDFPRGGSESVYGSQLGLLVNSPRVTLEFGCEPTAIVEVDDGFQVTLAPSGREESFTHVISSIRLESLLSVLHASGSADLGLASRAASRLRYRHLVLLNFVFPVSAVKNFQEHWIDVHDPAVSALRVTNFGNYHAELGDGSRCGVGLEYNCWGSDDVWTMTDEKLRGLGLQELRAMGLVERDVAPAAFSAVRLPHAYPVYMRGYRDDLDVVQDELGKVDGLILAGRHGLFKWNNMHHSVKTGLLAARNVHGANHDLSAVKGMVSFGKDSD